MIRRTAAPFIIATAKTVVSLALLWSGFRSISDDDFSRVAIAQQFAVHPHLDPSGTSWLPLPFWVYGGAMKAFGLSLATAQITAILLGVLQFSASVTGWPDPSVTWSSSGGVIDQSGHFTAPSILGVYAVTATSRADSSRSATVAVRVGEIVLAVGPQGAAALTQGQLQFSATAAGWPDGSVVWSTTGGEVDANGLFVAPVTPGRYTIMARSVADPAGPPPPKSSSLDSPLRSRPRRQRCSPGSACVSRRR